MICGMVVFLVSQMHFLNTGLHKFEALRVVPVYQSVFMVFGITGGLVFFQEYHYMNWTDLIMYSVGIVILLMGVVLLVWQRAKMTTPGNIVNRQASQSLLQGEEGDSSLDGLSIGNGYDNRQDDHSDERIENEEILVLS